MPSKSWSARCNDNKMSLQHSSENDRYWDKYESLEKKKLV